MGDISPLLSVLLSGGTAGTVWAIIQGFKTLRDGARTRTKEVMSDLERYRDEQEARANREARDAAYWRQSFWTLYRQVVLLGKEPAIEKPVPPSEREKESDGNQ